MSAILLHRLLGFFVVLSALGIAASGVFALTLPAVGEPMITTWPVVGSEVHSTHLSRSSPAAVAHFDRGTLVVESSSWAHAGWRLAGVLVVGGLILVVLETLRRTVGDVRNHRPFSIAAEKRLVLCAACLGGLALWSVLSPLLWSLYLLQPGPGSSFVRDGWMTFTNTDGEQLRIWLEVDWGLGAAALICVVLGRVFSIGAELQRDSDEII